MIPLVDIFEHIRKKKKKPATKLRLALGITGLALKALLKDKILANEHIEPWIKYLELDIPGLEALYQYNEREQLLRSLPEIVCGRMVHPATRYKAALILFYALDDIEVPINKYISKMYPVPLLIDNTIHELTYGES